MKTKLITLLGTATIGLLTLSSCDTSYFDENEINPLEINTTLKGLPIGTVTYQAGDLFKNIGNGLTTTLNDENVPVFSFSQDLNTIQTSDYVDIQDINIPVKEVEFKNKNNISSLPGSPSEITASNMFPFDQFIGTFENNPLPFSQSVSLNGVDLNYSNFKSGNLTLILSSSYDASASIDLVIPSIINKTDKSVFSTTINFLGNGTLSNLETKTVNVDLTQYEIDYTYNTSGNTYNNHQTVNNLVIDANTSVTVAAGDKLRADDVIKYKIDFNSLKPNLIKGDMSGKNFSVDDATTNINFGSFESFKGISGFKPKLTLNIKNAQGLPLALDLNKIKGVNTQTGQELALTIKNNPSGFIGNKVLVEEGTIDSNNNITEGVTSITLDNNNSNIGDILDINPEKFSININQADLNPSGETENFFDIDETIKISIALEMPLYVKFDNVAFETEFNDFNTIELDDKAEAVSLNITTLNAIPLSGTIHLSFKDINGIEKFNKSVNVIDEAETDANGNSLYEITNNQLFNKNNPGIPISGKKVIVDFTLLEIQALKEVKKIKSSIFLNSSKDVKLKNTDKIQLQLALAGDLKIKTNKNS